MMLVLNATSIYNGISSLNQELLMFTPSTKSSAVIFARIFGVIEKVICVFKKDQYR